MENWLRNPRVQGTGDAVLAAFLAVTSVVPVLAFGDPSWGQPKALGVALGLLSTVPVAWRARRPLTAFAIVLGANGACIYAAAPHQAAFQPFVALTLTAYSVGSRAEGRRALWAPPVLVVASVPVFVAARLHGQDSGNIIPSFVWLVAAWAVGRTVRSWRHKNVALEAANRELEEQRELQAQAAVAVERGRIARELHDVVAHNVSMIVVQAGAAARVLHGEQPDVRNALEVIAATGRETVDEMRHAARRAPVRRRAGRPQAATGPGRSRAARQRGPRGGTAGHGPDRGLTAAAAAGHGPVCLQDRPGSADQHAEARRARPGPGHRPLRRRPGHPGDHGHRPRPARRQGTGHGLVGMRERAAMFGGELEAAGAEGGGFTVRARLPLTTPVSA